MKRRTINPEKTSHYFGSLDDFFKNGGTANGGIEVQHNGLPFHFHKQWINAPVTLVSFNGGLSDNIEQLPAYVGFGISSNLNVNRLLISDPSNFLSRTLKYAWYAGNEYQRTLQQDIVNLINHIAGHTRVILFGTSGGGFAALVSALQIPGATVIATNSSTDISIPHGSDNRLENYIHTAWNLDPTEEDELPFISNVVSRYKEPVDAQIIMVQNSGDTHWLENHFKPFVYSAHPDNKIVHNTPYLENSHQMPDKESFRRLITLARDISGWESLREAISTLHITRNL